MAKINDKKYSFDFFVSYAEADEEWVSSILINGLENAGKSVATFERTSKPSIPKPTNAEEAINKSKKLLLVVTPAYIHDPKNNQYNRFIKPIRQHQDVVAGNYSITPVLLKNVELEGWLGSLEPVDFRQEKDWEAAFQKLVDSFDDSKLFDNEIPSCPYLGLDFFQEKDHHKFYGREDIVNTLRLQLETNKFLAVLGSSGSGKSSLVNAGLIPFMKQGNRFQSEGCSSIRMTPERNAISTIKKIFGGKLLEHPKLVINEYLLQKNVSNLIIFIDQFEELFSLSKDQKIQDKFCALINSLCNIENVYVVIAVRTEFYKDLTLSKLWETIDDNYHTLRPLLSEQLATVIVKPAHEVGIGVDPLLVERIVNDAGREPGILPFIQVTMSLLWDRLQHPYLALDAYENLRPTDSDDSNITGLKAAIAIRAQAAMSRFKQEGQEDIVRCLFLRLVNFGENGAPDTRGPKKKEDLLSCRGDLETVITNLSSNNIRLLIVSWNEEDSTSIINIVHDSVIDGWPQLKKWINEFREAEEKRKKFEFKLKEWIRLGQAEDGLLSKLELDEANSWINDDDIYITGIDPRFYEFINSSKRYINPGWSFMGIFIILSSGFSFISLFLYMHLVFSLKIGSFFGFGFWAPIFSILVFFIYYVMRSVGPGGFASQKVTHAINNKYIFHLSLLFLFISLLI